MVLLAIRREVTPSEHMKRLLLVAGVVLLSGCTNRDPHTVPNPDPNHTHADFAVWVDEVNMDFSDDEYMSGVSYDEASHDEEDEYHHQYLHLHDNVGHVLHRHKPGLSLKEFFDSLGFRFDPGKTFRMFINEEEVPFDLGYIFKDLDVLLLTTSTDPDLVFDQLEQLTDDACLYSRRCPWRGDPPAENCVADPSVPCVVPEEDL